MSDITKTPYAPFLEDVIGLMMEQKPTKIAIVTLNPDGSMLTGYFGDCDQQDKALLAHQIYSDSIMDIVRNNAGMILEAADEEADDEDGS